MSKPNLLLIDDEERVLRTLKSLFRNDYKIFTTTDGHEAIQIAKDNSIHVIISDQRMPIMPGVEVLRQVRQVSPNTMRILLTGYSDLAAIVGSVNDGEIYRYINKPWVTEELEQVVKEAAETALSLAAMPEANTPKLAKPVASATAPQMSDTGNKQPGLLVVDDNEVIYQQVKTSFAGSNPIYWAKTVEDAFAILSSENIAVVITDISINNEDISRPLKTLKQINPHILTMVLTSFQDTNALIHLINQCQIYRYLPKPVMQEMLERSVKASLMHYSRMQAMPQLVKRHKVDKPSEQSGFKLSSNIMGYLKKIRSHVSG